MDEPLLSKRYSDEFLSPLLVPFQQNNSILRTGLCVLMSLVPVLNVVYLTGYKHQTMIATAKEDDIPPDPMNVIQIGLSGLILSFLNIFFYLIPILLMYVMGFSPILYLLKISDVVSGSLSFLDWLLGLFSRFAIVIGWQIVFGPLFLSAQMHYAKRGSLLTFLNLPYHLFFVLRNISFFVKAELFSWMFWILAIVMEGLVAPTGIGLLLWPPLVAAVYIISTGYEYGVRAQYIEL
jgi:hypothetical protein